MDKSMLQNLLEQSTEVQSYSGRSMYGKECLGVQTSNVGELIAGLFDVLDGLDQSAADCELGQLADAFRGMQTDSMGRGIIVYFPDVPFVSDEDDGSPDETEENDGLIEANEPDPDSRYDSRLD